ncbi:MAG: three-Cys-motif partner protein TcmP [Salinarimonas sp.]
MTEKPYEWLDGAKLGDHSRIKHKIIREYLFDYFFVRCRLPQQERFRLAIVDGFAGGGQYECGSPGSPLIIIQELKRAVEEVNIKRTSQGIKEIDVQCLLIFNDSDPSAIELLNGHVANLKSEILDTCPRLQLIVKYFNSNFENIYPDLKAILFQNGFENVIFNLDQCGHSHIERETINDIMQSFRSAEIFYTFFIKSLLAFLHKTQKEKLIKQLHYLGLSGTDLEPLDETMNREDWLGKAEQIVYDSFHSCAQYVSPFSINNPDGWRYWLIHFSNNFRARQVYNNVLHENSSLQAHFGRSGLNMLSYDPRHGEQMLYLFDETGRETAKAQLFDDIPRVIAKVGDVMPMNEFYKNIYNMTPAHANDIHAAIIENPDLEVITTSGGARRKSSAITSNDTIKMKTQRSFFQLFKKY